MNPDYSLIVSQQRAFFNSNATKPVAFRVQQLRKLKVTLQANEQALMEAIDSDFKKSEFDTYTNELMLVYSDINEAIRNVKKWTRKKRTRTNLINFPAKSYVIPEPLGVSLIIGAWNYPYQLSFAPMVAAIAAGCTVILKPSELPAATSKIMAKIMSETFPQEYIAVVEGSVAETTALLEQKFDTIFFTGSVPVGRIVYQAAAKQLTPVTLELGGKSPAFVTENCNLNMSVKRLVWAKFLNAGQTCIAPDYVLVHQSVKHAFLDALTEEIRQSDFKIENGNYVQIINERNGERLAALLGQNTIHFGGTYNRETRYFEPTVLADSSFDDSIMQEEIFGPILPVIAYNDLSEAIRNVKERPKPLSCYIFTSDSQIKQRILSEVSFGGGAVNDAIMHVSNSHLPFGGVGESGIGSYHGIAGFNAFSHYKSILDKSTWFELNLKYSPHSLKKLNFIKKVLR
ncbi:aldehyde dehydrogenase [Crocinitomicaceae bacterium CZZ-1]|uniref:Aldehyde dehydrogenase n=1 Tax=Taishania pollutisoli TaxID=2766479 RepID=A0A8J6TSH6_9FLAO|nr:aldehyde dehydrogenase [Taishania pollutisoli]MBC9811289.1 aldehyde dehydrogenase [Taishania pollutisoli]